MNNVLSKALVENTPRINDEFIRGIGKSVFENIPNYLNEMIKISLKKIDPRLDFKYNGYKIVSPEEELMEDTYARSSNKPADIAQNNVYLVKFMFTYFGQPTPKYIYLPYCDPGNLFSISGTKYVVMPVLTDLVHSVKPDRIFIRLHQDKIHVTSSRKRIIVNDNPNPELPKLLYSKIFNSGSKDKMRTNAKTPLGLYLLCKYGLYKSIKQFCNLNRDDVIIRHDPYNRIEAEKDYKGYTVYSSVGEKPKGYERQLAYKQHKIKVLVKDTVPMDSLITNIVGAIIMAFDMVNGAIEEDLVAAIEDNNVKDEMKVWRLLLGRGMYKHDISIDKIINDVEEHMVALDGYIDEILKKKLANGGIIVDSFWEYLVFIINIYAHSVNNAKEYNRDINNMYLDLYYYICYDIIIGFNRAVKQINQRFEKTGFKPPSKDEIKCIINNDISERIIYNLVKSYSTSLALAQADVANDSMYYKGTALLENQNRGEGVKRGGKTTFPDSVKTLSGFMLTFGSLLYLIKAAPTPTLRANPWAKFNPTTGHIVIDPKLQSSVDKLENILRGITETPEELKNSEITEDLNEEI